MTVQELSEKCGFSAVALPCPSKEVNGCYIGDLLSWVMGRAKENDAWITIMSNQNVIAVASLADVACVILAEGVTADPELVSLATEKNINILTSTAPLYETACLIASLKI
jgi:hypothetical protein